MPEWWQRERLQVFYSISLSIVEKQKLYKFQ